MKLLGGFGNVELSKVFQKLHIAHVDRNIEYRRMERRILGDASPDNYAAALVRAQRVCRKLVFSPNLEALKIFRL